MLFRQEQKLNKREATGGTDGRAPKTILKKIFQGI